MYKCESCDTSFKNKYILARHISERCIKHKENELKNYNEKLLIQKDFYENTYEKILNRQEEAYERRIAELNERIHELERKNELWMKKYYELEKNYLTKNQDIPHFKLIDESNIAPEHLNHVMENFPRGYYLTFGIFVKTVYDVVPTNIILADASRRKVKIFTGKWEPFEFRAFAIKLHDKSYLPVIEYHVERYIISQNMEAELAEKYRAVKACAREVNYKKLAQELIPVLNSMKDNISK